MTLVMTNVLYGITLDPQLVGVACVGLDVVTMYFLRVLVFPAMIGIWATIENPKPLRDHCYCLVE
jgi:hypothetical protein